MAALVSNAVSRSMGSPSLPLVAQVFNPCVSRSTGFQPVCLSRFASDSEREAAGRRHAQKPVRRVPHGGRSGAFEKRTHKSRRRRVCFRPAAVPRRRTRIECDPYAVEKNTPGWTRTSDPEIRKFRRDSFASPEETTKLVVSRCPQTTSESTSGFASSASFLAQRAEKATDLRIPRIQIGDRKPTRTDPIPPHAIRAHQARPATSTSVPLGRISNLGNAAFWRTTSGRPKPPISLLNGTPSAGGPLWKCH